METAPTWPLDSFLQGLPIPVSTAPASTAALTPEPTLFSIPHTQGFGRQLLLN